jgi:hypothetical protein
MSKEKETRCIVNDVILVGKLRNVNDKSVIDSTLSHEEQKELALKKYQFTLVTDPSEAAKNEGFNAGRYFQIRTADPAGETMTLANGRKVRLSSKTGKYGWANVFESNRKVHFDEIREELLAKRVQLVGGDPNNGTVRLNEYGLMGFWDEFPAGFFYEIMTINKTTGKKEKMMSAIRQDDGTFKKQTATSNIIRHFVFQDEEDNLEAIRENLRKQVEKYKVVMVDNTTDNDRGTQAPANPVNQEKPATETPKKEVSVDEEP